MRSSLGRNGFQLATATILLVLAASAADADPIESDGYTIIDLGPGTATYGNGIVTSANGQMSYSFPQTPNTVLTPGQGIMANFPQFPAVPGSGDYGNPANDFNYITDALMNSNGLVAAMDVSGVNGHGYQYTEYAVQHNPDGSWGQPITVYVGTQGWDEIGGTVRFDVVGLSKSNELLLQDTQPNGIGPYYGMVYNANTNTTTNLINLVEAAVPGFLHTTPLAIDDQGRILIDVNPLASPQTDLLLIPDGVSAEPLQMTVPEPSTLALMLLAMAGYAIRRARRRPAG